MVLAIGNFVRGITSFHGFGAWHVIYSGQVAAIGFTLQLKSLLLKAASVTTLRYFGRGAVFSTEFAANWREHLVLIAAWAVGIGFEVGMSGWALASH